jgi:hypothetical protein
MNGDAQQLHVASKSARATRTFMGGTHPHSHNFSREPEPAPRDLPPRTPTPAEHGLIL